MKQASSRKTKEGGEKIPPGAVWFPSRKGAQRGLYRRIHEEEALDWGEGTAANIRESVSCTFIRGSYSSLLCKTEKKKNRTSGFRTSRDPV